MRDDRADDFGISRLHPLRFNPLQDPNQQLLVFRLGQMFRLEGHNDAMRLRHIDRLSKYWNHGSKRRDHARGQQGSRDAAAHRRRPSSHRAEQTAQEGSEIDKRT